MRSTGGPTGDLGRSGGRWIASTFTALQTFVIGKQESKVSFRNQLSIGWQLYADMPYACRGRARTSTSERRTPRAVSPAGTMS